MKKYIAADIIRLIALVVIIAFSASFTDDKKEVIRFSKTPDFAVTGDGSNENWKKASWQNIPNRTASETGYDTKVKTMYSSTGMYFLYFCEDKKLTNVMSADFLDLWNEDVIEVFIQPDQTRPLYLEYEISPLNYEIPILIYNDSGRLNSWVPFHYNNDQKTRHATSVQGGEKKSKADVKSWTAEFFLPYKMMKPITSAIPRSGTVWKGNIFRIDYDKGAEMLFSWQLTSGNFHEVEKFGNFVFE